MLKSKESDENRLQQKALEIEMITPGQHSSIKELYIRGTPKRAIARLLGMNIKTVRRHLKKEEWVAYTRPISTEERRLAGHEEWLLHRVVEVKYNASILFRELKLRGYLGSYETVKSFVRPLRQFKTKACVRYETEPGEQSQVDWGSDWVWLGDTLTKIHFFGLVLGYSRRMFVKAYLHERLPNLINGHEEAFSWFGGMTAEILYDNPKTMITVHSRQTGELILNSQFKDFAEHYGFSPRFCAPYRPQTKGKIESGVKYVKNNFLPGRRFRDLEHLNAELLRWIIEVADVRIHGTLHERPMDRFSGEGLQSLKGCLPYVYTPRVQRKVSQDGMVSFETNRYSVPWEYVGRCVDLLLEYGQLSMICDGKTIAQHEVRQGKHQQSICLKHYEGLIQSAHRKPPTKQPLYDPYWIEQPEDVMVRNLAVYDQVMQSAERVSTAQEVRHA